MVYCCFCCGMYEELFTKNCDNVVSCMKTLSLCQVPCVSVPPILSYINLKVVEQRLKMWGVIVYIVVCSGLWVLLFVLWSVGVIVYIVCVVVCGCYCLHCGVLWSVGVIVYIVVCCGGVLWSVGVIVYIVVCCGGVLWSVGVIVYIVVCCGLWVLLFTLWCVVV